MDKIITVLRSRKFWTLVAALVAIAAGYAQGEIDVWQALQALIAATSAYSVATGVESGLTGRG
ncbi:MAG: hypothetical protein QF376_05460 [Anaerolineales bacterium]|nr:hypothetical protein [Anaerolineales bacterium]